MPINEMIEPMVEQLALFVPNMGAKSRQGLRGKENDDYYAFFEVDRGDLYNKIYLAVVADGVTSTVGGAQASKVAVETLKATLQIPLSKNETLSEWLEFAIIRANEKIALVANQHPEWHQMSTTIVVAALAGPRLYVMHLGDSRAYLLRSNKIHQLTTDHTWTQVAIDAGQITTEAAKKHPKRNQLQRYLSADSQVDVDRGVIDPDTRQHEEYLILQPGDAVLLCTDGLYSKVEQTQIKQCLLEHVGYPQDAIDDLIENAVEQGERDDITAVLLELPPARKETLISNHHATRSAFLTRSKVHPARIWLWWFLLLVTILTLITHQILFTLN